MKSEPVSTSTIEIATLGVERCLWPLPDEFRFDELVDRGQVLGHSPDRVAEHLRAYQRFEMVDIAGGRIQKTGRKPYF